MTWLYRGVFMLGLLTATWAHGYMKGQHSGDNKILKKEIKTQTVRADNAEKQRDIANAAPASIDDVIGWLRNGSK